MEAIVIVKVKNDKRLDEDSGSEETNNKNPGDGIKKGLATNSMWEKEKDLW